MVRLSVESVVDNGESVWLYAMPAGHRASPGTASLKLSGAAAGGSVGFYVVPASGNEVCVYLVAGDDFVAGGGAASSVVFEYPEGLVLEGGDRLEIRATCPFSGILGLEA